MTSSVPPNPLAERAGPAIPNAPAAEPAINPRLVELMKRIRQNYRIAKAMAHIRVLHEQHRRREAVARYHAAQQAKSLQKAAKAHAARPALKQSAELHRKLDRAAAWLAGHGCHPKAPLVAYHLDRICPGWRHRYQARSHRGRSTSTTKKA